MPVTSSWSGHSTVIRKTLIDLPAPVAASLSETLTDTDPHYLLASEIEPIPVYRRFGNIQAYLLIGGLEASFNVSGSNVPIASANAILKMVTYLLDKDTMTERPVFETDPLNGGIARCRTYSIDGELSIHLNHFDQIQNTGEYYTTAYDPIDDVTFNIKDPGLITKIGFVWVYQAWGNPAYPISLAATATLSGRMELLVP